MQRWSLVLLFQAQLLMSISFLVPHVQSTPDVEETREKLLDTISELTAGTAGPLCVTGQLKYFPVTITDLVELAYDIVRQKGDTVAQIISDFGALDNHDLLNVTMVNLVRSDSAIETVRVVTYKVGSHGSPAGKPQYFAHVKRPGSVMLKEPQVEHGYGIGDTEIFFGPSAGNVSVADHLINAVPATSLPWYQDPKEWPRGSSKFMPQNRTVFHMKGWWTYPYYWCLTRTWQMTYSIRIAPHTSGNRLEGLLSFDVDVSRVDINQCEKDVDLKQPAEQINHFSSTHKCDVTTSTCRFAKGFGWIKGGYNCTCRPGFYAVQGGRSLNGTKVEMAWSSRSKFNDTTYDSVFRCVPCVPGCGDCTDGSSCYEPFNETVGVVLLTVSMVCVAVAMGLMGLVYRYRRLKVFKVASPIFLCITLLGCAIMYGEMAAIFPPLHTANCVATKWTRHMGFCVTYTALLMKTWRVSLTYRIKSAHKLKLTDRQLLQWMFPILLVMVVYLAAWTAGSPPIGEILTIPETGKIFTQCTYNWWDHTLALGEMLFLLWGIRVCYSVRRAETYYNESQHISWAIYNISAVNVIMATLHLILYDKAGPDLKYFLGFIRTQLSTTVTIALVFGPKFYLVIKGLGNEHDNRARAKGVTASFSLIGMTNNDEPPDLQRENEELKSKAKDNGTIEVQGRVKHEEDKESFSFPLRRLKLLNSLLCNSMRKRNTEELQKLSGQMEYMKIVHMSINNPHLKVKAGSYFNPGNTTSFTLTNNSSNHREKKSSIASNPVHSETITHVQTHSPAEEIVPNDSPTTELLGENA